MDEIFTSIVQNTHSELIFALIVVVVFLIMVSRLIVKYRKDTNIQENNARIERQQQFIKREAQLLEIISKNTEAITNLKTSLEDIGVNIDKSFDIFNKSVDEIIQNQLEISKEFAEAKAIINNREN